MKPPFLTVVLYKVDGFPNKNNPRHRFEKNLEDGPWSETVSAIIELEDPAWEVIGYPYKLMVDIGTR